MTLIEEHIDVLSRLTTTTSLMKNYFMLMFGYLIASIHIWDQ